MIPSGNDIRLSLSAAAAYKLMHDAMANDGYAVIPLSGYRSYNEQMAMYGEQVELVRAEEEVTLEEAKFIAEKTVAEAGSSEHQYGNSIDISSNGERQTDFLSTEQGRWMTANAWKYGFILRYPAGKSDITGREGEPWHYRYVGTVHSEYMNKYKLCLEEYVALCKAECPDAVEEEL
ncbi:MAG: M15 family metallopeptidase [Oscillospiraceae bacterium]|jgi:D-alanyl-D-alanine carboxypeptidase|nr:M15 family metallopeptidase [Oscillospiraceae bacterium]